MTSFKVIKTSKTNRKFCNCKSFAKLKENNHKTFLALKSTKDLQKADNFVVSCFAKYGTRPVLKFS